MFPTLKTGVVAQYPFERTRAYATRVMRFLDAADQRWREFAGPLRRWVIRLELLDETEVDAMRQFFSSAAGRSGSFAFTDPWDGTVYTNCSLESDEMAVELVEEGRARTSVVVRENRT